MLTELFCNQRFLSCLKLKMIACLCDNLIQIKLLLFLHLLGCAIGKRSDPEVVCHGSAISTGSIFLIQSAILLYIQRYFISVAESSKLVKSMTENETETDKSLCNVVY